LVHFGTALLKNQRSTAIQGCHNTSLTWIYAGPPVGSAPEAGHQWDMAHFQWKDNEQMFEQIENGGNPQLQDIIPLHLCQMLCFQMFSD